MVLDRNERAISIQIKLFIVRYLCCYKNVAEPTGRSLSLRGSPHVALTHFSQSEKYPSALLNFQYGSLPYVIGYPNTIVHFHQ